MLTPGVTVVSNQFVDQYMAGASGEYVKVYLYFLRHGGEAYQIEVERIADGLNLTESDVRRALAYWQRMGVLAKELEAREAKRRDGQAAAEPAYGEVPVESGAIRGEASAAATHREMAKAGNGRESEAAVSYNEPEFGAVTGAAEFAGKAPGAAARLEESGLCQNAEKAAAGSLSASVLAQNREPAGASRFGKPCDMEKLTGDETFSQLLYIAQRYLNKTFTPADCQVMANLYVNLEMAPELLEFLVEYCAQNHHYSLRYVEKVALSWHERGIRTVEQAKAYSRSFSKDSFAVMKAMGLTGRSPADSEYALMEKWFRTYGFSRELVVEACSRTIQAIHTPSFQYADRILTDWKEAGVRTVSDIAVLDKKKQKTRKETDRSGRGGAKARAGSARPVNRFHNLEEHGYDYEEIVWNLVRSEAEAGGKDGAQ